MIENAKAGPDMWYDDVFWVEAIGVVMDHSDAHRRVFGPIEFVGYVDNLLPLEYMAAHEAVDFFCCPKDDVDLLPRAVLDRLDEFTCVFANDVFVAYERGPTPLAIDGEAVERHTPYFLERVARLRAGEVLRQSRLNPRFPVGCFDEDAAGRRVLVVNAGNMGNFGDEILAAAAVDLVNEAMPDASIIVSEPAVDRSIVDTADHVVLGGGGVLYELLAGESRPDFRNVSNYFRFGYTVRETGSTFTVLGLGHQQPTNRFVTTAALRYLRGALANAAAITTRDADTRERLVRELVDPARVPVHEGVDLSFALLEVAPARDEPVNRLTVFERRASDTDMPLAVADAAADLGITLRVGIQANEDPPYVDLLRAHRPDRDFDVLDLRPMTVADGIAAFAATDAVITSRFHAFVMALCAGVPVVGVDVPGGKIERLANHLFGEATTAVLLRPGDTEGGCDRVEALVEGRVPIADRAAVSALRERARDNIAVLRRAWGL